jgi:uncharacterized membrane protein HdeD (DUF308 family)
MIMKNPTGEGFSKIWWLVLLRGILVFVLGLLFLTEPGMTLAVLVVFLGAYWFVHGIFSIIGIFVGASGRHWGWLLLDGIIGILAGIFVMNHPLFSAILIPTTLVVVLAIQGIIMGLINLVRGFKGDGARAVVLGIINLLFGVILLGRPLVAATLLPFIFGVFGMSGGILLVILSFRIRRAAKELVNQ